jgi:hypothetical protein
MFPTAWNARHEPGTVGRLLAATADDMSFNVQKDSGGSPLFFFHFFSLRVKTGCHVSL